ELAIEAGCNAYAAPLGFIEAGAAIHAGEIPTILKCNNSDGVGGPADSWSAVTATPEDALRLGCAAVGFTIYPGSDHRNDMYGEVREMIHEARALGLASVVWSYPRGNGISKEGETSLDVVAYAAHIAAQLGAHVIKVKPPAARLEQDAAKKAYEKNPVPMETLADRVAHIVQSSFNGRRLVVFSGGAAKGYDEILEEVGQIHQGGGTGSIIGRNSFQRSREEGLKLLADVMAVYKS
ncbi:MAG: class I fructose-bisphosphate aldolase, partial [Planctomycetota bacterium]